MTKTPSKWPYDDIFEQPGHGILQQQLVTYKIERGKMVIETITRRYFGDNDYQDSVRTEVICDATEQNKTS